MKKLTTYIALLLISSAACQKVDDEIPLPLSAAESATDGSDDGNGFCWVLSKDLATRNTFVRTFGVGYSYDAVRGSFCNWEDIRCQVISLADLQKYQQLSGIDFYHNINASSVQISSRFDYSLRDYVANITLASDQEINLGLYNGAKRTRQYVIENGVKEQIYYTHTETSVMARQYIEDDNIAALVDNGELQLLTNSFVNAVLHIANTPVDNFAVVDSFINVYGTHVITNALLGGALSVEIKNDMWRYSDEVSEEQWSEQDFLAIIADKESLRQNSAAFQLVENSQINISATGGDQSPISAILGEKRYDGTRLIDLDAVTRWRKSLTYNPDNPLASNVELIDMQVTPIWDFIYPIDEETGDRVKSAILQDASLQQKLLGDNNFFSTSFPAANTELGYRYRYKTDQWKSSTVSGSNIVKNIISNGRYVATICYGEQIGGKTLTVAYPIYEGKINLACGLGIASDGTAYKVRWSGGKAYSTLLTQDQVPQTSTFYINAGSISLIQREDVKYEPSFALPFVEISGGVQPDGGYSSQVYDVTCDGDVFYCQAPQSAKLVAGWEYVNELGCWQQTSQYTYIYNPHELDKQ